MKIYVDAFLRLKFAILAVMILVVGTSIALKQQETTLYSGKVYIYLSNNDQVTDQNKLKHVRNFIDTPIFEAGLRQDLKISKGEYGLAYDFDYDPFSNRNVITAKITSKKEAVVKKVMTGFSNYLLKLENEKIDKTAVRLQALLSAQQKVLADIEKSKQQNSETDLAKVTVIRDIESTIAKLETYRPAYSIDSKLEYRKPDRKQGLVVSVLLGLVLAITISISMVAVAGNLSDKK